MSDGLPPNPFVPAVDTPQTPPVATGPAVDATPVQMVSQASFVPTPSAQDELRAREQAFFARKLKADDIARAQAGAVTLIATSGFTLVDDPEEPEGRTVRAGQEFRVSAHDLQRYASRGVPKALDGGPGVTVEHDQP